VDRRQLVHVHEQDVGGRIEGAAVPFGAAEMAGHGHDTAQGRGGVEKAGLVLPESL
jgi:hypothetical protein